MGKLKCKCGNVISDNSPNNTLMAAEGIEACNSGDDLFDILLEGYDIWECDKCFRLAITRRDQDEIYWYTQEGEPSKLITEDPKEE